MNAESPTRAASSSVTASAVTEDTHLGTQPLAVFFNGSLSYEDQDWLRIHNTHDNVLCPARPTRIRASRVNHRTCHLELLVREPRTRRRPSAQQHITPFMPLSSLPRRWRKAARWQARACRCGSRAGPAHAHSGAARARVCAAAAASRRGALRCGSPWRGSPGRA